MGLRGEAKVMRGEIEALYQKSDKIEGDQSKIRAQALAEFSKRLDGTLKNLQEDEGVAIVFHIHIIGENGKVRRGSGSQRNMPEYIEWRKAVYERDGYRCQECGSGVNLNAHHVKSWISCSAERFNVGNGITLCEPCHAKRHPHLSLFGTR